MELGLSPAEFWNFTPRELALLARARGRRAETETRRLLAIAWHVAAFMRVEKLPPLEQILAPPKSTKAEEQELARLAREHEEILKRMGKK